MKVAIRNETCDESQTFSSFICDNSSQPFSSSSDVSTNMDSFINNEHCDASQKFLNNEFEALFIGEKKEFDGVAAPLNTKMITGPIEINHASSDQSPPEHCESMLGPDFSDFMVPRKFLEKRGIILWLDSFDIVNYRHTTEMFEAMHSLLVSENATPWDGSSTYQIPPLLGRQLLPVFSTRMNVAGLVVFVWHGMYVTLADHLGEMRLFAMGFSTQLCEVAVQGYSGHYSNYILPCISGLFDSNKEVIRRIVQTVDDVCDRRWCMMQLKRKLLRPYHTLVRAMDASETPGWISPQWELISREFEPQYICKKCGKIGLVTCCPETFITRKQGKIMRRKKQLAKAQAEEYQEKPRVKGPRLPKLDRKSVRDITSSCGFTIEKRNPSPGRFFHTKVTHVGYAKPFSYVKAIREYEDHKLEVLERNTRAQDCEIWRKLNVALTKNPQERVLKVHPVRRDGPRVYVRRMQAPKATSIEATPTQHDLVCDLFGVKEKCVAQSLDFLIPEMTFPSARDIIEVEMTEDEFFHNVTENFKVDVANYERKLERHEVTCEHLGEFHSDVLSFLNGWKKRDTPQCVSIFDWQLGNRQCFWRDAISSPLSDIYWHVIDNYIEAAVGAEKISKAIYDYARHVRGTTKVVDAMKFQLWQQGAGTNRPRNLYDVCAYSVVPIVKFYTAHGAPYSISERPCAQGLFSLPNRLVDSVAEAADTVKDLAADVRTWLHSLKSMELYSVIDAISNAVDCLGIGFRIIDIARNGVTWTNVLGLLFDIVSTLSSTLARQFEKFRRAHIANDLEASVYRHLATINQCYTQRFREVPTGHVIICGLSRAGQRIAVRANSLIMERLELGLTTNPFYSIENHSFCTSSDTETSPYPNYRLVRLDDGSSGCRATAQGMDFDIGKTLLGMLSGLDSKMRYLRNFNTIVNAWRSGKQLTQYFLNLLPKCILEFFGLISDNFVMTDDQFQDDVAKYAEISKTYAMNPLNIKTAYKEQDLIELYTRFLEYHKKSSMSANRGAVSYYLNTVVKELRTIITCHQDSTQLVFDRYNPYAILLTGLPGVGKSEVAKRLGAYFVEFAKDPELMANTRFATMAVPTIYCYQSQLDYMDGYCKEGVVVIDELGQRTDGEDLDIFYSFVSNMRYVCPMASMDNSLIGKKGTTFTSHTIIACSNVDSFSHLTGVFVRPDALDRRFICKLQVTSVGERMPDFSHLRFSFVNGDGSTYTLKQIAYILKEHPQFGFKAFYRGQFSMDQRSLDIDTDVDLTKVTGSLPPPKNKVVVQGFDFEFISRTVLLMTGTMSIYMGVDFASKAPCSTIQKVVVSTVLMVNGAFAVIGALWSGMVSDAYAEAMHLKDLTERLRREHAEASRVVRQHINNYVAESGGGGGKHAAKAKSSKSAASVKSRSRILVHGDQDTVDDIREILYEFLQRKDITEAESEFLEGVCESLEPVHQAHFVSGVRAFNEKRKLVEIDPNTTDLRFKLSSQGVDDHNAREIENKCARALCWIILHDDTGHQITGMNAIPLTGTFFLIPYHFVSRAKPNYQISISWIFGGESHRALCSELTWKRIAEDATVISFPRLPWRAPSLIKYFVREANLDFVKSCPLSVVTRKRELNEIGIYSTMGERLESPGEYEDRDELYTLVHGFHYQINTRRGDCGAPVLVHDNSVPHKIVGMHVAGMENVAYGMAHLVTYEMLSDYITSAQVEEPSTCVAMGTMELIGVVPEGLPRPSQPRKTGFYRTHVSCFPVPKEPVDLRIRNGYDPVLYALMKNSRERPERTISKKNMTYIANHIAMRFPKERMQRELTDEETINGKILAPLNLRSSMGYPYVLDGTKKGELLHRDLDGTTTIIDDGFRRDWDTLERQIQVGPPDIYWISCGKDECLKPGKEPRVFEIPPFHYSLSMRKHFGAFISWVHNNPMIAYSAIGINPESSAWNKMYERLRRTSALGLDFDWKKFDSTLDSSLLQVIELLCDRWYGSPSRARSNLLHALAVRPTFYEQFLFLIRGGNPSGNVLTTILNTFAQAFLIMDAWLSCVPFEIRSLYHFDRLVCVFYYGDDGIMTVHPDARPHFTFTRLREHFAEYLMIITTAQKDGSDSEFRPIEELTFLKRGFRLDDHGMIVPTLSLDSMYTMLNYNYENKKVTPDVTFDVISFNFCAFAYFHGREAYDTLTKMAELECPPWDYWDDRFYGSELEFISFQTF